jgi:nucleotide-binding universal stress UspA family protein
MPQQAARVVVGVDDSLAGLRALREAVGIARSRRIELLAVRACPAPQQAGLWSWSWPLAGLGVPATGSRVEGLWQIREREVQAAAAHAFDEAMGGMPCDVPVSILAADDRLPRTLVNTSQERDVLVIATPRKARWWPFRRSIVRYCTAHADCPVLVVPPLRAARELDGRWRPRRALRRHELSGLLADPGTQAQRHQ